MRFAKSILACSLIALIAVPALVSAAPIGGVYFSTDLGGQLLTGRASTWRSGVSSGLPHVLHVQSWDGLNLGTQWDISCPTELTNFTVQDNRVGGAGTIDMTILGPWESAPEHGVYSNQSDVAKALIGHSAGEIVTFMGNDYTIESIRRWTE